MSASASPLVHAGTSRSEQPPVIREHKIPSAKSEPYICMEGPDRALWFCESGASKIGRFDPADASFREFALPRRQRHADRHHHRRRRQHVVLRQEGQQDRPHHHAAATSRCSTCRHPNAGPDGTLVGPDGNVWFSETELSRIGRITPDGKVTEFADGISPGARPLSIAERDGAMWFSEAAGNRVGRITMDGVVTEFPIPSHDSQPRAMATHPDGSIWFVQTSTNSLGRIDRDGAHHRTQGDDARTPRCAASASARRAISGSPRISPTRSAACARTASWSANIRSRRRAPARAASRRMSNGRMYVTLFDAGMIGEVIPQ